MITVAHSIRRSSIVLALAAMVGMASAPVAAQGMQTIDPNTAIDADLNTPSASTQPQTSAPVIEGTPSPAVELPADQSESAGYAGTDYADQTATTTAAPTAAAPAPAATTASNGQTYHEDDLIGAAEGVFGKGAKGLADLIKGLLKDQGEPNAYIVGREGGGALVFGVRYGSGTLFHKVEGEMPVYWTGPSVGFDAGANAGSTFVLVYNLYDSEELYKRFPAGEGQAYFVGGFNASYMRRGDTVLIPVRAGAGLRLGVNAGYMKFSKKQRWLPF